ncbi:MAG: AAA family ATPase [Nostocales cyanobacterium LacPavin_0920_SED1_MAG_38_18]|nr:AAA family ATPase [Nostocales cyanobacterium LacPavin_0920_SED1_MAG_38_18]
MIKKLHLKNFKAFADENFDFKPLTLISGLNSTGKSSVIQPLILLRYAYRTDYLPNNGLKLDNEIAYIGTGEDAIYENADEELISFGIVWENDQQTIWNFDYDSPSSNVLPIALIGNDSTINQFNLFNDNFHYLGAERITPEESYPLSENDVVKHRQIGKKGEYTAHFLHEFGNQDIPISELSHPCSKSQSLKDQVDAWMGEISPNININIRQVANAMTIKYSFGVSKEYSPFNVGFGVTYSLPILTAILSSKPGTMIIIENPESHLHPQGQSQLGQLLALAANHGIQVIIESHSDHILNGIRIAVHGGKIKPEDVQLHFFEIQSQMNEIKILTEKQDYLVCIFA